MNFGEFRKDTQLTHLHPAKPHGYWAEARGVCMPTPHLDLTLTFEVHPKNWTTKKNVISTNVERSGVRVGFRLGTSGVSILVPNLLYPSIHAGFRRFSGVYPLAMLHVPSGTVRSTFWLCFMYP